MQGGNEFQQMLDRYESMVKGKNSFFFDVDEFADIIDYYLDIRDFEHAYEAERIARLQHPGSIELKVKLVHTHLESGKPHLAIEALDDLSGFEQNDPEYYLLKGTALSQLSRFNEAEKFFDLAIAKNTSEAAELYVNISIAFENARQFKLAIKYLKKAHILEPENLSFLYDLAYFYERIGELEKSIAYYNMYLDADPYSENVWYNLGVIHHKSEQKDRAIECYDFAIAVNPTYGSAYFNKANIFAGDGNYIRAIHIYKEYLQIEPESLQGWCYLGECFEETGNFDKALEIYKKIIAIDNTFAEGWYGAGLAYMQKDRLNEAITYILKAIDFDKENPEYWFSLGEIYELRMETLEAKKCYRYVCRLDNEDREAWIRLSMLYINEKEYADALVILREAYQNNFNCQDIIYMIAALYFRLGDYQAGMSFFDKGLVHGKGGLKLFYQIYPEGDKNEKISKILKNR